MNRCPFPHHPLRPDLPPLTEHLKKLPVDERGYPVPFFVKWLNGVPDFRIADVEKLKACIIRRLCWVCGQPLRGLKTFPVGPMCSINRVSSEPPSHLECAEWSVKGCPFLSKPQMRRRDDDRMEEVRGYNATPGILVERNPGVTVLWTTISYRRFSDGGRGMLFRLGEPETVTYWAEGRPATRREVQTAMETGLPILLKACQSDEQTAEVLAGAEKAFALIPAA